MRASFVMALLLFHTAVALAQNRITVITDAFGRIPRLEHDWGYAALVEVAGRRILFDTGNDARKFERNVRALGIDLRRLDFVVISHRHGDHTAGLRYLRRVNPHVRIYVPQDEHFGGPTPQAFFRPEPSLPPEMRYFGGEPPPVVPHGSAWGDIPFIQIERPTEVLPGVRVVPAVSDIAGTRDLRELALAIETPEGQIIVVGCSHPGVDTMLRAAAAGSVPVRVLAGGFHWVTASANDVRSMTRALRDEFKVHLVAPGHCTGEIAFKELKSVFDKNYLYAGVGTVIELPK